MPHQPRALLAPLLLFQAGLALLAALGLLVYARSSNALGVLAFPEAIALGGPLALLALAIASGGGWRWTTAGIVVWETLTLLGTIFSALVSGGSSLSLTVGLTGIALPAAILVMAVHPSASGDQLRRGLTVGLLLVTGLVHLALVPEHLGQASRLGFLFALDGAAFVVLALVGLRFSLRSWWRWPTIGLLLATILAYLGIVVSRREAVDELATKLIELAALGLLVWPRRLGAWRMAAATASLVCAVTVSGAVVWAASFRPGPAGHTHDGRVVLAAASPTAEQRDAAARLVDDTRAGIERYQDLRVALADGYRPTTPPLAPTVHYVNQAFQRSGRILDPTRPPALVYANTANGPLLLGAMYMTPRANTRAPDTGGSLAEWHTHPNLCFMLPTLSIDSIESPFGTCPIGSINAPTPAMLHVWTVANPGGPFADLSPAFVARLTDGGPS